MISGYIYLILWLALAAYTIYLGIKVSRFFFVPAGFFLFSAGWTVANELIKSVNLFGGWYVWVFRGVAIAVLIVCVVRFILYKTKGK
ncbi:MAG: hypothetical protein IJJ15_09405 [Ruminococcus sp.]|nr:hypothetical protein [Ruminococcus sp.]